MTRFLALLSMILCTVSLRAQEPAKPAAAAEDAALMRQLEEIDARAALVKDLAADFEQKKFTPLLKKPLVSSGHVRVKGGTVRWDTVKPEPSVMRIDEKELRLYYPAQKIVEVYPIGEDMRQMTASPLPRLAAIRAQFSISRTDVKDLDPNAPAEKHIALVLIPTVPAIKEHVATVKVLLDIQAAIATRMEMTDPDGERTVISFTRVKTNSGVSEGDLELKVPEGTKITRPLEGIAPGGDAR